MGLSDRVCLWHDNFLGATGSVLRPREARAGPQRTGSEYRSRGTRDCQAPLRCHRPVCDSARETNPTKLRHAWTKRTQSSWESLRPNEANRVDLRPFSPPQLPTDPHDSTPLTRTLNRDISLPDSIVFLRGSYPSISENLENGCLIALCPILEDEGSIHPADHKPLETEGTDPMFKPLWFWGHLAGALVAGG